MNTLKLVIDNEDSCTDEKASVEAFVLHNAPTLAQQVLRFILGKVTHDILMISCQDCFLDWWKLKVSDSNPSDDYESVFWYLLFLIESRREDELLGNRFINQHIKECACYLINKGKLPHLAHGIRP